MVKYAKLCILSDGVITTKIYAISCSGCCGGDGDKVVAVIVEILTFIMFS